MPACKHDASAFLFLRWLKSLCLKYNNTCALQIIAQIVYSAGIDTDNSWSENVVLTVFTTLAFSPLLSCTIESTGYRIILLMKARMTPISSWFVMDISISTASRCDKASLYGRFVTSAS